MTDSLQENRFDFIAVPDKDFILGFEDEMTKLGYDFGGRIGSGYCWGKYMMIYRKSGGKSKKVVARIYIRDESVVLRLFLNDIDKHREYIENSPAGIKEVFIGDHAKCNQCHNDKDGKCRFRKTYTLEGRLIEKCNGITFEFHEPSVQKIPDYMALFTEFYPNRRR
jgi:hypothetical protein